MKAHIITEEEYNAVKEAAKRNQNKVVDKRLRAILLRYEGKKDIEIGEKLDYSPKRISQLCAEFKRKGLAEYMRHQFGGNHHSLTFAQEEEILKEFREKVAAGKPVTVPEIKKAFDEKRGKDTGRGYIYTLLTRHGWQKAAPRDKHPGKASDEGMEASKEATRKPER